MRKSLALTLLALTVAAGNAFATGEGRMQGKVIDAVTKKPIPNATIHYESTGVETYYSRPFQSTRRQGGSSQLLRPMPTPGTMASS